MPSSEHTILIIEDEATLLAALSKAFALEGFRVLAARDSQSAWIEVQKKPDIILLDIILPGKSGKDFLQELKVQKHFARIPVVVLTNVADSTMVSEMLSRGALDYCVKADHTLDEIVEKVKMRLGVRK